MKVREGSMKVSTGEIYSDRLILICAVEGTPKGSADIKVEVERDKGRYSFTSKALVIALNTEYMHKRFREGLGIRRMTDVDGLRQAAEEAAKAHWDKFKATPEQEKAIPAGKFDECVSVATCEGSRGHQLQVTLAKLPYSAFLLEGDLSLSVSDDLKSFSLNSRNSGIRREMRDTEKEIWQASIPTRHNAAVLEFIRPVVAKKMTALISALLDQKRAALVLSIERSEEEVVRSRSQVKRHEREAKEAREALEKFDQEQSTKTTLDALDEMKGSATALGGTSAA